MKNLLSALTVSCGLLLSLNAHSNNISGTVFNDANNNGVKDKNETGIKGVAVSDQVNVVLTDANGTYTIPDSKGFGIVFISMPQGYKAVKSFYQAVNDNTPASYDFPLAKVASPTQFTFIHASDTHISEKSLDRIQKFQAAVDSIKPSFVVITGDLIKDALRVPEKEATGLYELFMKEMAKTKAPVMTAPGNHEIFGIERHLSLVSPQHPLYGRKMYRHYLGPDYYSFNYGGLHFIALNSLDYEDTWYFGSIDSVQQVWLKKDLESISATMPVVTFQHVPFISAEISIGGFEEAGPGRSLERENGILKYRHVVSNAHEMISLLQSHPFPLALGGHHHSRQLLFLETQQKTRFEQAAAVVAPTPNGAFLFPSGVTVYKVNNGVIDEGKFVKLK